MTKKEMNILFACDSHYAIPLTVCITSIFENNKDNNINIFVLYSTLTEEQKNILVDLAKKYNQKINLIQVAEHYFSTAPTLRWTKETYYRLLVCDLLPANLDRLLYFDCDIIINKPLEVLYNLNLGENYLAMLGEKNQLPRVRLGLRPNNGYFQGGVILFDLKKGREILNYEKITKTINELGEKVLAVDQDIINVIFDGKIKTLDKKFNNYLITNFNGSNFNRLFNYTDKKEAAETYIFHYVTSKPWNNLYSGACEEIWYKYLKLSPFKDLYTKKYNKLKHRILTTGIIKLLFYKYINLTPHIDNLARKLFSENLYTKIKKYYRQKIK